MREWQERYGMGMDEYKETTSGSYLVYTDSALG